MSFSFEGGAHRTKTTMTSVKELKKAKRKLKTAITKSLTDLAGRLSESKPDRTGIKAVLEGIEERKQEVLSLMEELEFALEKEERTDEAEKVGDEADSLIGKIDQETSQARSFLASIGISSKALASTSVDTQECNPHVANSEPRKQLERIRIPMFTGNKLEFQQWFAAFSTCVDTTSLAPRFKMLRLESCLRGEAAETIKSLGYSEFAYNQATYRRKSEIS